MKFLFLIFLLGLCVSFIYVETNQSLAPDWVPGVSNRFNSTNSIRAVFKLRQAKVDYANFGNPACERYFLCVGNKNAVSCCGMAGRQVAEHVSNMIQWYRSEDVRETNKAASKFGRDQGDCRRRYILNTLNTSNECAYGVEP